MMHPIKLDPCKAAREAGNLRWGTTILAIGPSGLKLKTGHVTVLNNPIMYANLYQHPYMYKYTIYTLNVG
jgi:hypothetical protein